MKKSSLLVLTTFVALTTATELKAQVLYSTDFNAPTYTDGNLVGQDGWVNHSGTGTFIQVADTATDGNITLLQGGGSREDANHGLGMTMGAGDIWSAAFDVTVTGGSSTVYFAHFKDAASGFNGRIFVTAPSAGGDFTFGISEVSGSTPDTTFSSDFTFGTTYRPTVTYNFDTGLSTLTIGASTISSTTADIGQPMEAFAFRQASGDSTMVIDNLVVTAVPEPSTLVLTALGGIASLVAFRKRA